MPEAYKLETQVKEERELDSGAEEMPRCRLGV
jgi:hypothetical protein